MDPQRAEDVLAYAFRTHHGRVVAALLRAFGTARFDVIEDAVQDALARAAEAWTVGGVPARPDSWLLVTARRRLIDILRRERSHPTVEMPDVPEDDSEAAHDELSLIFICCLPALTVSSQVALTLKVVCGFSTAQIARAFLSPEPTIAQRLVRAKAQVAASGARFALPDDEELPSRLEAALRVLYLMFNEGYASADLDDPHGEALCIDALRLIERLLQHRPTAVPEARALAGLFALQLSRFAARRATTGSTLLLDAQDRALWDRELIERGFRYLAEAGTDGTPSAYHLEAAIAGCHAAAPSYGETNFARLLQFYDALRALKPSPVVEVNRAVVLAAVEGPARALAALDAIADRARIEDYPYALVAYARLFEQAGDRKRARGCLERALRLHLPRGERARLELRLASLLDAADRHDKE
jgi:RNA polymerase sigma-70 factor (ECF subfamily)